MSKLRFMIASHLFLFAVVAICISTDRVLAQAAERSRMSDEALLRDLKENKWPKAYFEQDAKLLDSILADEFQMVNNAGEWSNKAKELERVNTSKPSYDTLRFEIRRLEIFENGTAIVAGSGRGTGRDKDGAYTFEYQSSNILIKRGGQWKAVASHVSGYKRIPKQ